MELTFLPASSTAHRHKQPAINIYSSPAIASLQVTNMSSPACQPILYANTFNQCTLDVPDAPHIYPFPPGTQDPPPAESVLTTPAEIGYPTDFGALAYCR